MKPLIEIIITDNEPNIINEIMKKETPKQIDYIINHLNHNTMKAKIEQIKKQLAEQIINDNAEYIVWADDTPISVEELTHHFRIVQYDNGTWNLHHKTDDYQIEDINH